MSGEVNIGIAAMTMTSERSEAVDFVAPYFDQSGISIITRLPVKPKSLFKFMDGEIDDDDDDGDDDDDNENKVAVDSVAGS